MKDATRYNLWTQFLEDYKDYKEYFNITESQILSDQEVEKIPKVKKAEKSMKLKKMSIKKETPEQKRERTKTEISILHQKYKTLKSENLHKMFDEQPELWKTYHEISEENERSFPEDEIPRNRIINELKKIQTKRTKNVIDMGCGKAQISEYFKDDTRFNFTNYDHIANNDTIISCDISSLPIENNSVEIVILSLEMWGSNCREYIEEANRVLESGGKLYIIEPTKRWSVQDEKGNIISEQEGCKLKSLLEEKTFQVINQKVVLDEATKRIEVVIDENNLSKAIWKVELKFLPNSLSQIF